MQPEDEILCTERASEDGKEKLEQRGQQGGSSQPPLSSVHRKDKILDTERAREEGKNSSRALNEEARI